jgi:uracil phosphoribosyltransferase
MFDALKWEVTDNKELLEYVKEFERIITAEVYNQVKISKMTQTTPHGSV